MTLRVATALTDAGRESAVVRAVSEMPDAVVARRCRDVVELRAVAHSSQVDAVVVDGGLRGLDLDVVTGLAAAGVRCVVVGVRAGFGDVVRAVPTDLTGIADALREPVAVASNAPQAGAPVRSPAASTGRDGRVVVVWGPMGGPGRTTLAIELAAALSDRGADVMLVDLDTTGPSAAQLLGLLDDTSGVAAAARLAADGRLDATALAGLAVSVPSGPRVLVGLPSPDRWTELRPGATDELLRCARDVSEWTIVDIGPGIEGDDLAWLDTDVPQRFGAARATLAAADLVVCVGRADPVGLTRLLRQVPTVGSLSPTALLEVVVNRAPSRGAARQAHDLVSDVLGAPPQVVDDDGQSLQRAQLLGVPVRTVAPDASLSRAGDDLAERVIGQLGSYDRRRDQARRTHRRLLRRADSRHRRRDAGVV